MTMTDTLLLILICYHIIADIIGAINTRAIYKKIKADQELTKDAIYRMQSRNFNEIIDLLKNKKKSKKL